jgi:hypothetical protein
MSVMMLIAALSGPRLAASRSPRRVSQAGLVLLAVGALVLVGTIDYQLARGEFALGLAVYGAGAGLLASQLGNVIMSSVEPSRTNEAGGLQGTAQNLGASFGTALIGAILLSGLTSGFVDRVTANADLPADLRATIAAQAETSGVGIVSVHEVRDAAAAAGLPPDQATALADDYAAAQLDGLRVALGAVALFAALASWFTRRLPAGAAAQAPAIPGG